MTIELTTFSAPQPGYKDKRIGNFALAFERKERRSATFANILVDATWATWMVHDDFPANEANADIVLLKAGLKSRKEIIEARGREFETVRAEIAADPRSQTAGAAK